MIKKFCDDCGIELNQECPRFISEKIQNDDRNIYITVVVVGGDLCKYCVLEAINTLDDREAECEMI